MNFHFILQLLLHLVERQNLDNSNNFSKRNCYSYDENRERPSSTSAIPSTLSNNFMILLITNSLFGWFLGFHIALHWCSWQMCVQSTMRNETELPCWLLLPPPFLSTSVDCIDRLNVRKPGAIYQWANMQK